MKNHISDRIKEFVGLNDSVKEIDDEYYDEDDIPSKAKLIMLKPQGEEDIYNVIDEMKNRNIIVLNFNILNSSKIAKYLNMIEAANYILSLSIRKISDKSYIVIPYENN